MGPCQVNFSYLYSLHNHMQDSTIYRPIGHQLLTCDKHNDSVLATFSISKTFLHIGIYLFAPQLFRTLIDRYVNDILIKYVYKN